MFQKFNRFDPAKPIRFCSTDDTPGAGGGGGEDENPKPKTKDVSLAVESAFVTLVAEHGSPDAAAKYLIKRNHSLQSAKDKAETEVVTLKAQKPDEATQKLTDQERAELDAYRAYGKPDELKTRLESGDSALKEKSLSVAAKALKMKPGALFQSLLGNVEFEFEGEGDERKVKSVKVGDKNLSFEDYAKTRSDLTEALPLLQEVQQQRSVTRFGKSAPVSTGTPATNVWDRIRDSKKPATDTAAPKSWQEQAGLKPAE